MAKVTKEAVGQYNYVVPELPTDLKRYNKLKTSRQDIALDASIELVVKHPRQMQLIKIEPPKLYETNYNSDFQPPPQKNLIYRRTNDIDMYSAYGRSKLKSASAAVARPRKEDATSKTKQFNEESVGNKNKILKSLIDRSKHTNIPRAKTAEPAIYQSAPKRRGESKRATATTAFERAIIQGKPDWKHEKEKSYDILKPEKPDPIRNTKPYGSNMENLQEMIAQKYMDEDDDNDTMRSCSSMSLTSRLQTGVPGSRPQSYSNFLSRASSQRSRTSTKNAFFTSTPNVAADNQLSVILEEMDDSIEQRLFTRKSPDQVELRLSKKVFDHVDMGRIEKTKKNKQLNLYKRKVPDKRFYQSKIRQTPNEMNQYKKMRNRTFFKPLEQAIHEKDFIDHEVKYASERQLVKDAKWRIRQDLKDVRTNNINSLVDRFEQRMQMKKQEKSQRTGYPKYMGDPVDLYRSKDFEVRQQVAPRRRITPSIGSVQRARNLSNYANIWNQPAAQPNWGPQKVDHNLFLPPVAMPN